MKLYACFTPSHEPMLRKHFLPSTLAEFGMAIIDHRCNPRVDQPAHRRVRVRELEQHSATGAFKSDGFQQTCLDKVDFIIEALAREAEPFLFSDVDVRFYGPVVDDLLACLGDADMAFQWDGPTGRECSGFMVLRPNDRVRGFWQAVRRRMIDHDMMDQDAVHAVLGCLKHNERFPVEEKPKSVILPERYWTFGRNDRQWRPGHPVNPPADLLVHHANWCVGVDDKLLLLDAVRDHRERAAKVEPTANVDLHPVPRADVVRMLEEQRTRHAIHQTHHPMPMALVLQFWKGDKRRAMELARMLADIEPERRRDVALVFARQDNCPMDQDIDATMSACGLKFSVVNMEVKIDPKKEYPGVCYDAWANAVQRLSDAYHTGRLPYGNAFFFEPDGCPIGLDWIDRLKRAHEETLLLGKRVTGPLIRFGGVDASHQVGGHINGTMVMHLSCWDDHPSLRRCPPDVAWDVFHGLVLRMEASPSQIIRNEHGATGLSESMYHVIGKESAWLTSVKDGTPQHWCRRYVEKVRESERG